jgi:hypothetical protein
LWCSNQTPSLLIYNEPNRPAKASRETLKLCETSAEIVALIDYLLDSHADRDIATNPRLCVGPGSERVAAGKGLALRAEPGVNQ